MSDPTAEDWAAAVAEVYSHYPLDIFPWPSDTEDGKAAFMARRTCENIERTAHEFAADRT